MKCHKSIYKTLIILIVLIIQAQPSLSLESFLELRPEGYVFGDYQNVFDAYTPDGITIEGWFYLNELPKSWADRWVLIYREGEYDVIARGPQPDWGVPDGSLGFSYSVYGCRNIAVITLEEQPLKRWIHFAYLVHGTGPVYKAFYIDGMNNSHGSCEGGNGPKIYGHPFYVGGVEVPRISSEYSSLKGYVDEIRISKGWRYDVIDGISQIDPPRRFQVDEKTLALWHFDEGLNSKEYRDSSGNGYTLYAGGSLSVEGKSKIASTWGMIRNPDHNITNKQ
jgi:hypothetical protein